jgi:hypothetical protein
MKLVSRDEVLQILRRTLERHSDGKRSVADMVFEIRDEVDALPTTEGARKETGA